MSFLFSAVTPCTPISTPSLHDALPISYEPHTLVDVATLTGAATLGLGKKHAALFSTDGQLTEELDSAARSEEHTSELQSRGHLVCRLLLEKKKIRIL